MKANRTCIVLIMLFCANVLFAQRKEAVSISLDEIKDMPQKIITAYFKPVYSTSGVWYPLMQWYAISKVCIPILMVGRCWIKYLTIL